MTRRNRKLCVEIARDVLAQLRLQRYEATPGTYVSVNSEPMWEMDYNERDKKSFQEFFAETKLEAIFGGDNINLMESAFECGVIDGSPSSKVDDFTLEAAGEWGMQYDNPDERMRAIMMNIARNNGDFKLPKKYIAAAKRERLLEEEFSF